MPYLGKNFDPSKVRSSQGPTQQPQQGQQMQPNPNFQNRPQFQQGLQQGANPQGFNPNLQNGPNNQQGQQRQPFPNQPHQQNQNNFDQNSGNGQFIQNFNQQQQIDAILKQDNVKAFPRIIQFSKFSQNSEFQLVAVAGQNMIYIVDPQRNQQVLQTFSLQKTNEFKVDIYIFDLIFTHNLLIVATNLGVYYADFYGCKKQAERIVQKEGTDETYKKQEIKFDFSQVNFSLIYTSQKPSRSLNFKKNPESDAYRLSFINGDLQFSNGFKNEDSVIVQCDILFTMDGSRRVIQDIYPLQTIVTGGYVQSLTLTVSMRAIFILQTTESLQLVGAEMRGNDAEQIFCFNILLSGLVFDNLVCTADLFDFVHVVASSFQQVCFGAHIQIRQNQIQIQSLIENGRITGIQKQTGDINGLYLNPTDNNCVYVVCNNGFIVQFLFSSKISMTQRGNAHEIGSLKKYGGILLCATTDKDKVYFVRGEESNETKSWGISDMLNRDSVVGDGVKIVQLE
ncbi:WD40-repeat-containing_domain superfamily [Hexamita inflata]|uniref:WD40-repeat-containing domain superfamily n=1 Tax=Hexamita inflata TaxID=28002 RepID=A0AA86TU41_9EUKA|nr:WD40-repeat-containing domain superfamily [Hexamita inflata]